MDEQNNKKDKLTDKAFSRLMWTSFLAILVCVVCLCSSTYAWFTESKTNTDNQIKAAECLLTFTLSDGSQTLLEIEACNTSESISLENGSYTVSLELPANSASGYLVLACDSAEYYSDFIQRHTDVEAHTLTFELIVNTDTTLEIKFTPRWGIYAGACDVTNGGVLEIGQAAPSDPAEGEQTP